MPPIKGSREAPLCGSVRVRITPHQGAQGTESPQILNLRNCLNPGIINHSHHLIIKIKPKAENISLC